MLDYGYININSENKNVISSGSARQQQCKYFSMQKSFVI